MGKGSAPSPLTYYLMKKYLNAKVHFAPSAERERNVSERFGITEFEARQLLKIFPLGVPLNIDVKKYL